MKLMALSCEALARNIYALAAETTHTVTVKLLKQGLHNHPRHLREELQREVDAIPAGEYEAILLVYGMCGRSTVGLVARQTPLVMPRAHDCITLYLGSRERYQQEFERHPGTYWYSLDYMERQTKGVVALGAANMEDDEEQYEKYVAKYGQETADELMEEMRKWSQHYTRAVFIDMGTGDGTTYAEKARSKAEKEGWIFERMEGNRRLLRDLVNGDWNESDFLVVPSGYTIEQTADEGLIRAVPIVCGDGHSA
jgi:hypothetical protein